MALIASDCGARRNLSFRAHLESSRGVLRTELETHGAVHSVVISPRSDGLGSSVNGGELLFLALAACYCNDIYREAARRNVPVESVRVTVQGDFPEEGVPATNVTYDATVVADAGESEIRALIQYTDTVAEIHNTMRAATPVRLNRIEVVSTGN